jgi:hypothetical protein
VGLCRGIWLRVFLGSVLQTILLRIENKKRRADLRDVRIRGLDARQIEFLGDMRLDFIYTT